MINIYNKEERINYFVKIYFLSKAHVLTMFKKKTKIVGETTAHMPEEENHFEKQQNDSFKGKNITSCVLVL